MQLMCGGIFSNNFTIQYSLWF